MTKHRRETYLVGLVASTLSARKPLKTHDKFQQNKFDPKSVQE